MRKLIRKLFKYETMSGAGTCPIYLERWELLSLLGYEIYLHHFLGDDWALDPHDHPRRFISIGLKGGYIEDSYKCSETSDMITEKKFKAPWIRSFPAEHIHRIRMEKKGETAWTVVIVLRKSRRWGFWQYGKWIGWKDYVHNGISRKSC
jgi:hypothetical protein